MKKMIYVLFSLLLVSCSIEPGNKTKVSVATWNVQTFFDSTLDGTEYAQFRKEDWNASKYEQRLDKLCKVLMSLDADIIVMEELENEDILYDINNRLAGNSWNQKKMWTYCCFSKNEGSSIGCGVFSRFEICDVKLHNIDIRTEKSTQPSTRPIMEVSVCIKDRNVSLFVNHWKSKSDGAVASEVWRNWQEEILGFRVNEVVGTVGGAAIICGDFNRDIQEFKSAGGNFVELRYGLNKFENGQIVKTCWMDENGLLVSDKGSYYYNDDWERIDHIFVSENLGINNFQVFNCGDWCTESGIPLSYKIFTNSGYSDHVPLKCEIEFLD